MQLSMQASCCMFITNFCTTRCQHNSRPAAMLLVSFRACKPSKVCHARAWTSLNPAPLLPPGHVPVIKHFGDAQPSQQLPGSCRASPRQGLHGPSAAAGSLAAAPQRAAAASAGPLSPSDKPSVRAPKPFKAGFAYGRAITPPEVVNRRITNQIAGEQHLGSCRAL